MRIAVDTVVTIEYSARLDDGHVVDSTDHCGPITYLHGNEQIFPALERVIDGLQAGMDADVRLSPSESYGEWRPELVRRLPRAQLPDDVAIELGGRYTLQTREGQKVSFRAVEFVDEDIVADFNHRAAGQGLHLRAKVLAVRAATPDEVRRGTLR